MQSRINTAKSMLEEVGASVPDTQWEVSPTYSLAVSDDTMTESEIANAILQTASDEIVDGTAVYLSLIHILLNATARLTAEIARVSGVVPQIAVVTGTCAGTNAINEIGRAHV